MSVAPKIISFDIETSPGTYLCYGNIWDLVHIKTVDNEQILSFAWQVVGEKKVNYLAQNMYDDYVPGKLNDKRLVEDIVEILNDCNYRAGQNIDQFDIKMIQQRCMFHRIKSLSEIPTLDTKKMMKTVSRLPSNKLQHISEFLGHEGKLEHGGSELFVKCMQGDAKAWELNRKYNMRDVKVTTEALIDILPYVKLKNDQKAFSDGFRCKNPLCMSLDVVKNKKRKVVGGWTLQYQCKHCGKYFTASRKESEAILLNEQET